MAGHTRVIVEVGGKRAFASAADWPGWCRSGKTEEAALEALAAYAPRYAKVAKLANIELPKDATHFAVAERLEGNATTDFGAPGIPAKAEARAMTPTDTDRMVALVEACWKYLDQVRTKAPKELRKGPRGGGRDRDKMWQHVLGAESAYASGLGVRLKEPDGADGAAVLVFRRVFRDSLRKPTEGAKWPPAYGARRTAWHALDHAWEMEDRIP